MKRIAVVLCLLAVVSNVRAVQPDDLDNLHAWYKADTGVSTDASGKVTAWTDQSSNGHDLTPPSTAKPTYVPVDFALNNTPAVSFWGRDDEVLQVTYSDGALNLPGATIFVVFVPMDTGGSGRLVAHRSGSDLIETMVDAGNVSALARSDSSLPRADVAVGVSHEAKTAIFEISEGGASDTVKVTMGAVSDTDIGGYFSTGFSSTKLTVGGRDYGPIANEYRGRIAEVIFYTDTLTSQEKNDILDYLDAKYTPSGADTLPSGMGHAMRIAFTNYTGAPLTNFPALVVVSDGVNGFDYDQTQPSGTDLRFTEEDGETLIPYEIEDWGDPSADSHVWVRVPVLTNNAVIYAWWGNDSLTSHYVSQSNGAVWAGGYSGVWHMDSINPGNSVAGGVDGAGAGTLAVATGGKVGSALNFSGDDYVIVDRAGAKDPDTQTITAWTRRSESASGVKIAYGHRPSYVIQLTEQDDTSPLLQLSGNNLAGSAVLTNWTHWAGVVQNGVSVSHGFYLNGGLADTESADLIFSSSKDTIGASNTGSYGYFYEGLIDEVRVACVVRSADWIDAEYRTVADNAGFTSYERFAAVRGTVFMIR